MFMVGNRIRELSNPVIEQSALYFTQGNVETNLIHGSIMIMTS